MTCKIGVANFGRTWYYQLTWSELPVGMLVSHSDCRGMDWGRVAMASNRPWEVSVSLYRLFCALGLCKVLCVHCCVCMFCVNDIWRLNGMDWWMVGMYVVSQICAGVVWLWSDVGWSVVKQHSFVEFRVSESKVLGYLLLIRAVVDLCLVVIVCVVVWGALCGGRLLRGLSRRLHMWQFLLLWHQPFPSWVVVVAGELGGECTSCGEGGRWRRLL